MRSTLAVTVAASDLHLLTVQEMRDAANVSDYSADARLAALSLSVAAAIAEACNVAPGAGAQPTLKKERLTETFWGVNAGTILLSRRHEIDLQSVTLDGVELDGASYAADPEAGTLVRLRDGYLSRWCARQIVVIYDAGFATIPAELKSAAGQLLRALYIAGQRDPLVKSERISIPDVRETQRDYWVGSVPGQEASGTVPAVISGLLKRYRNEAIA